MKLQKYWFIVLFSAVALLLLGTWCFGFLSLPVRRDSKQMTLNVLQIDENSSEGIIYHMENPYDDPLWYGDVAFLEKHYVTGWYTFIRNGNNTGKALSGLILYSLEPGESCDFEMDWSGTLGTLPRGRYRIVKSVSKGSTYSIESDELRVSAEFRIR